MPALSSYAPNTRRPSLASTTAPAHWAHGSSVTYRVQSPRRSVWSARTACCTASSSAWAVGSRRATVALCARATTTPSRNTTAPTGTSPLDAAFRASSSAAAMPTWWSGDAGLGRFPLSPSPFPALLCTRGLGHSPGDTLEGEVTAVLRPVDPDAVALRVLALEHRQRERVLQQPLDRPLERPRAVHRIIPLGDEQLLRRRRHFQVELALRHQPLDPRDLDVHDLRDVLARERPEDDRVIHPVQELRPERL